MLLATLYRIVAVHACSGLSSILNFCLGLKATNGLSL